MALSLNMSLKRPNICPLSTVKACKAQSRVLLLIEGGYADVFRVVFSSDTDSTSCSFPGFASLDCMSGNVQNPLYFYVLLAIKNFHDWVMRLHVSIGKAGTKVTGLSVSMGKDFVQTEAPVSYYYELESP